MLRFLYLFLPQIRAEKFCLSPLSGRRIGRLPVPSLFAIPEIVRGAEVKSLCEFSIRFLRRKRYPIQ